MIIGGYFGLELAEGNYKFHDSSPIGLHAGRASLFFILKMVTPKRVLLPYFSCNALLEPLDELKIEYAFYPINEKLEIGGVISLKQDELIIYIDFFGLKTQYAETLSAEYGNQLILDSTQNYFFKPNSKFNSWCFNSARKFFGVPDGSYLYGPISEKYYSGNIPRNEDFLIDHLLLRFNGNVKDGYSFFTKNEDLIGSTPKQISKFSETLLSNIDYESIKKRRRENFKFVHRILDRQNQLESICTLHEGSTPFSYPFYIGKNVKFDKLWEEQIYAPMIWKDCIDRLPGFPQAKSFSLGVIHIPIDQRYSEKELNIVIEKILEIEKQEKSSRA